MNREQYNFLTLGHDHHILRHCHVGHILKFDGFFFVLMNRPLYSCAQKRPTENIALISKNVLSKHDPGTQVFVQGYGQICLIVQKYMTYLFSKFFSSTQGKGIDNSVICMIYVSKNVSTNLKKKLTIGEAGIYTQGYGHIRRAMKIHYFLKFLFF